MKKKYILECYDNIIRDIQQRQLFPELSIAERDQSFSAESGELLTDQNEQIIKHYRQKIYLLKSKSKIEHFINTQHKAIENIADQLSRLINATTIIDLHTCSSEQSQTDSLKTIYKSLEKLVRYIEQEFNFYLDKNLNIPCISGLLLNYNLQNSSNNFLKLESIDSRLIEIAVLPNNRLSILTAKDSLTYNEFYYCLEYRATLQYFSKSSVNIASEDLAKHLFAQNLNTLSFFDYETDQIVNKLEQLEDPSEKLKMLYRELKKYNQRQFPTSSIYNGTLPNIKQQIVAWIEEEIDYHLRIINLQKPSVIIPNENVIRSKIVSGISVAQLSYTFNLLSQVGVINERNQMDIFRFIADNFKTKSAEQISINSIKTKSYNVESSTKAAVREKMIAILNLTKL